jgi:hypothetical protein
MKKLDDLVKDCDLRPDHYFRLAWNNANTSTKAQKAGYTLFQIAISKTPGESGVFHYMNRFGLVPADLNSELLDDHLKFGDFSSKTKRGAEMLMMRHEIFQQCMECE